MPQQLRRLRMLYVVAIFTGTPCPDHAHISYLFLKEAVLGAQALALLHV